MKHLTKDQKYNRAKDKEAERNLKKQKEREEKLSIKQTRKVLSVSIKQEAFGKLELLARSYFLLLVRFCIIILLV